MKVEYVTEDGDDVVVFESLHLEEAPMYLKSADDVKSGATPFQSLNKTSQKSRNAFFLASNLNQNKIKSIKKVIAMNKINNAIDCIIHAHHYVQQNESIFRPRYQCIYR